MNKMATKTKAKGLRFRVPIVVEPDTPGFHAYSPALKGLLVDGDTEQEALANAKEATILYLECLIEDGSPIPLEAVELGKTETAYQPRGKHTH
ncbi:MAG: type II toxin-antitoxin system HicB family antitoxin [Dehalococcoidia bacterium]|nr:type II toxin-antitoxin system HicB family antitoxin [Dehalococcoidia bacterium]